MVEVAQAPIKQSHRDAADDEYWCRQALAQAYANLEAALLVKDYKSFTDGMEAAAQICGSLAETTYDDADAFEAATGCEAAIMRVVNEQRREQAAIEAKESQHG